MPNCAGSANADDCTGGRWEAAPAPAARGLLHISAARLCASRTTCAHAPDACLPRARLQELLPWGSPLKC